MGPMEATIVKFHELRTDSYGDTGGIVIGTIVDVVSSANSTPQSAHTPNIGHGHRIQNPL